MSGSSSTPAARTPHDLPVLFEDACIARDIDAAVALFGEGAIWCGQGLAGPVRGLGAIQRCVAAMWQRGETYVADSRVVLQAGPVALLLGDVVNVAHRGTDGSWRFAIALLRPSDCEERTRTMTQQAGKTSSPRVLKAGSGEITGPEDGARDRYMIDGADAGCRFAVVEHLLPPRVLAGPVHLHTREDEYSYVLEGRVGAMLGGDEVVAEAGDLIFKPREQWHTFWNASDTPARILEIISPAGLEDLFREFGAGGFPEPETLAAMAAEYGAELDFEATMPLVQRHALVF